MSSREESSKKGAFTRAKEKRDKKRKKLRYLVKIFSITLLLSSLILAFSFNFFGSKDDNSSDKNSSKDSIKNFHLSDLGFFEEYPKDELKHFNLLNIIKNWGRDSKSKRCFIRRSKTPQLVIIIDDVSNIRQMRAIEAIPYHITPSIFPPSDLSMHSNRLAKSKKHFMVHLPMQSGNRQFNKMYKTLFISDSSKKMRDRVQEIRRLFPNNVFINNHTGSVFTSNYRAMKRLYGYLREEGFIFVDSRTSSHSKVKRIVKEYKDLYIARDIFLDNRQSVPYILSQLRKAVKIAKHRGYAIAIGHPHPATIRALHRAKPILRGVKVVYIDELIHKP